MPTSHGISICIITERDRMGFPETPLPEVPRDKIEEEELVSRNGFSSLDGTELWGIEHRPKISAAVPIKEGVRFAIKYSVVSPHSTDMLLYFKLFINNRHLISWGIDPNKKSSGIISRALFEPNECDWQFQNCPPGAMAGRPFLFSVKQSNNIMKDGGVIDVRVYRSNGRFRSTPILETHRPQEAYGLLLPGGNLVRNPSSLRFYKWKLRDAIDEPYVIFRFNYHTRNFLVTVGIIEKETSTDLLQPSRSDYFLEGLATTKQSQHEEIVESDEGYEPDDDSNSHNDRPEPPNEQEEAELSLLMEQSPSMNSKCPKVSKVSSRITCEAKDNLVAHRRPSTPWQEAYSTTSVCGYGIDGQKHNQTIRGIRGGGIEEPRAPAFDDHVNSNTSDGYVTPHWGTLQNIPPRSSSLSYRVRRLSTQSRADSITPSLRSSADRDEPMLDSKDVNHIANLVQIQRTRPRIVTIEKPGACVQSYDDSVVNLHSPSREMQNSMHTEAHAPVAESRCTTLTKQPASTLGTGTAFPPVSQLNFGPVQNTAQPVTQPMVGKFTPPRDPKDIPNLSRRLSAKVKDFVTQMKNWSDENVRSACRYGKNSFYQAGINTSAPKFYRNHGGLENLTPKSSGDQNAEGESVARRKVHKIP